MYIIGFLFLILGLYIVDFDKDGIPYTIEHLSIHSLIIVRQWFHYQRIDGISWTLEIELYFYIIMFTLYQFKNHKYIIIPLFLVCILFVVLKLQLDWYEKRQILLIGYMLLGYLLYRAKHTKAPLVLVMFFYLTILIVMYNFYSHTKPFLTHLQGWYTPYLVAPPLFYTVIFFFKNYKIDFISKFLANISYPLYVVHQIFGYALLVYFLKDGYSSWFALVIVLFIVFVISYIIHLLIEKPALKYAKKFNRQGTQ